MCAVAVRAAIHAVVAVIRALPHAFLCCLVMLLRVPFVLLLMQCVLLLCVLLLLLLLLRLPVLLHVLLLVL